MSNDASEGPQSPASPPKDKPFLELRIAELEREKAHLQERASSAEASLTEANARAVAASQHAAKCEADMKGAITRAQGRYAEKLHANNESRNLRKVIEAQKFDFRDYHIKSNRTFGYLRSRIAELETKGGSGQWSGEHLADIQKLRAGLGELRNELSAALTQHSGRKAELEEKVSQMKAIMLRLNKDLVAERLKVVNANDGLVAEQAKVAAAAEELKARIEACKTETLQTTTAKYNGQVKKMEEDYKARLAHATSQSQDQLKGCETQWTAKAQHMMDQNNHLKFQLNEAHSQLQILHHQLQAAMNIRGTQQNLQGNLQGQHNSHQQPLIPSKRRRQDSISTTDFLTPTYQRARTQSLLSNSDPMDPNGDLTMQGRSYIMSPHGPHARQSSQLSNGSTGQMIHTQRFRQEHDGSSIGSPVGHDSGSPRQLHQLQQQPNVDYMSHPEHSQRLQDVQLNNAGDQNLNQAGSHDSRIQNTMSTEPQDWTLTQPAMGDGSHTDQSYGADMMNATLQSQQQEIMDNEHMVQDFGQFTTTESLIPTSQDTQPMNTQQQQTPMTPEADQPTPGITASSRSTSAPKTTRRRRAPPSTEPANVPCVNCYKHWWEGECGEGEPCANCVAENAECVRQRCFYFAAGTCARGLRCPNVHEGDGRYHDDAFLVDQTTAGKRPGRLGKMTDAEVAPVLRQHADGSLD